MTNGLRTIKMTVDKALCSINVILNWNLAYAILPVVSRVAMAWSTDLQLAIMQVGLELTYLILLLALIQ